MIGTKLPIQIAWHSQTVAVVKRNFWARIGQTPQSRGQLQLRESLADDLILMISSCKLNTLYDVPGT